MIVFVAITLAFALPLVLYAPQPESLHLVPQTGIKRKVRSCAGTLTLGLLLIFIAAALFDESFALNPEFIPLYSLSRRGIFENGFVFQLLTANLLHIDLFHLVTNLSVLVLLSAYERRVGWRRFTAVFWISAVISSATDLMLPQRQGQFMGASGGLCGLAAGYFLDYSDLSLPDWIKGLLIVLFIVGFYSYLGPVIKDDWTGEIDHGAHFAGVCAGAAYIYLVALPTASAVRR